MRNVQSTLFALLAASGAAYAGPIGFAVDGFQRVVFWIAMLMIAFVFGVMFYSMHHYRALNQLGKCSTHPIINLIWMVVPIMMLILMVLPTVFTILSVN